HSNTPEQALRVLSKDEDENILVAVAKHPRCPLEVLQTLLKKDEVRIKSALACNPNIPLDMLKTLNESTNLCVKLNIINNANTPKEILEKLCKDHSSNKVRKNAKEKLEKYNKRVQKSNVIKQIVRKFVNLIVNK
ncbi:hypothetical protein KKH23_07375, partial [Patescibacteria group bacterium]|nr:hypothetical protein [Patescibacteria group bacterium]